MKWKQGSRTHQRSNVLQLIIFFECQVRVQFVHGATSYHDGRLPGRVSLLEQSFGQFPLRDDLKQTVTRTP